MAVRIGSLDDIPIEPISFLDVGEGFIARNDRLGRSIAAQDPVDHHDRLGAGDLVVRSECAITVALHQPGRSGRVDVLAGPVCGNIGEVVAASGVLGIAEAGQDGRQLSTGDMVVGPNLLLS